MARKPIKAMHIVFLTLVDIRDTADGGLYHDLISSLMEQGATTTVVCPNERRLGKPTEYYTDSCGCRILRVKTLNIQKTNLVEKGLGTLALEFQFLRAIKKHLKAETIDAVVYATPPITFSRVVAYLRRRHRAGSYLLLKDIFPQNAVDIGMMNTGSLMHRFFCAKELALYRLSDHIGCMSQANVGYLLKHQPWLQKSRVHVNPNAIKVEGARPPAIDRHAIRQQFGLPKDRVIFVYGGNLGKPQGLDFLLTTIEQCRITAAYFLIVGNGTEFPMIQSWMQQNNPDNARLMSALPKHEFDRVVAACDVGMIFLSPRFTIPNYPSRLLAYLEAGLPVLAATDRATDIGDDITLNGCGRWVESGDNSSMEQLIDWFCTSSDRNNMGMAGYRWLQKSFDARDAAAKILETLDACKHWAGLPETQRQNS